MFSLLNHEVGLFVSFFSTRLFLGWPRNSSGRLWLRLDPARRRSFTSLITSLNPSSILFMRAKTSLLIISCSPGLPAPRIAPVAYAICVVKLDGAGPGKPLAIALLSPRSDPSSKGIDWRRRPRVRGVDMTKPPSSGTDIGSDLETVARWTGLASRMCFPGVQRSADVESAAAVPLSGDSSGLIGVAGISSSGLLLGLMGLYSMVAFETFRVWILGREDGLLFLEISREVEGREL